MYRFFSLLFSYYSMRFVTFIPLHFIRSVRITSMSLALGLFFVSFVHRFVVLFFCCCHFCCCIWLCSLCECRMNIYYSFDICIRNPIKEKDGMITLHNFHKRKKKWLICCTLNMHREQATWLLYFSFSIYIWFICRGIFAVRSALFINNAYR